MAVISTVQGVREAAAYRLNEAEVDNTDFYTNELNNCLDDIERNFGDSPHLHISTYRTLSASTQLYLAPSDFGKMNSITYPVGNVRLAFLTPDEFDAFKPSAAQATGNPQMFTIRGQGNTAGIEYFPNIGSGLDVLLDYQRVITRVSAGSASVDLPNKYYELPVLFIEARGLRRDNKYNESQLIKKEYEDMRNQMMNDLRRQTTEALQIRQQIAYNIMGRRYSDPVINTFWGG